MSSFIVLILCYGAFVLLNSAIIFYIVCFFIGIALGFKGLVMYTLLMEFFTGNESLITGILFFIDESVFIWSPLILVFVTNNAVVFVYLSLILVVVVLVAALLFRFPESIKFLLAKGDFEKAKV